jgi:hypothetical protein
MRQPVTGDVYVVVKPFATLGTRCDELDPYFIGDTLKLVGTTELNPFGRNTGTNWIVECKHYKSPQPEATWAWIHKYLERGQIVLRDSSDD